MRNANPSQLQFSAPAFSVGEGDGSAIINVTRTGETNTAVTVDYATSDGTAPQRTAIRSGMSGYNMRWRVYSSPQRNIKPDSGPSSITRIVSALSKIIGPGK